MRRFIFFLALLALPVTGAAQPTATITTFPAFQGALMHARSVNVTSYVLPDSLQRLLAVACQRGTHADVLLAAPDYDPQVADENQNAVRSLNSAGCTARTTTEPLHMKLVYMDGSVWLSDTNFSPAGFLLRVDDQGVRDVIASTLRGSPARSPYFATRKDWALDLERNTIASVNGPLCVSTESFGRGMIAGALADRRNAIRLVVAEREYRQSPQEQDLIERLPHNIDVRVGYANEKMAVGADRAWFGSANATAGLPEQVDWGMTSTDPTIVAGMQQRCLDDWERAQPLH